MKTLITSAILAVATLVPVLGMSEANAGHFHGVGFGSYNGYSGGYVKSYNGYSSGWGNYSYSQPIYHGPSVHYDAYDNLTWASPQTFFESVSDPVQMQRVQEDEIGRIDNSTRRHALMRRIR